MTDYAELREALDAGPTPGPWSGRTGGLDAGLATDCAIHTWERCIAQITDNPLNQRDMAYIAAAHPEAIRALLAERDALREALTELCDEIDKHEIHAAISKTSISWFKRKARAALAQEES